MSAAWMRGVVGGSIAALALGACAGLESWETERADPKFVDGTRVLAQVAHVYADRNDILTGNTDRFAKRWHEKLLSAGFTDADIVDRSELGAQTFCYAWDMVRPCRHRGIYLAHVDPSLQGRIINAQGGPGRRGDIVEIELRKTPSNELVGVAVAIYRAYDDWQDCRIENLGDMGIFKYSPSGPPNGAWLECDGLEKQGWTQKIVGPSSDPNKTPVIYVHEWIKLPPGSKRN